MNRQVAAVLKLVCTVFLAAGIAACAPRVQPAEDISADLYTLKQHFAGGRYLESMKGCRAVMDRKPGCGALDQGLYYATLNSLRLPPAQGGGKGPAADYLMRLIAECPASPYRPEAELWLSVLRAVPDKAEAGIAAPAGPDQRLDRDQIIRKRDQEIKRLRGENARLNREIDLLKNVDVQEHKQKKDLNDAPDEGKDTRP
jgi:hypothetical protein